MCVIIIHSVDPFLFASNSSSSLKWLRATSLQLASVRILFGWPRMNSWSIFLRALNFLTRWSSADAQVLFDFRACHTLLLSEPIIPSGWIFDHLDEKFKLHWKLCSSLPIGEHYSVVKNCTFCWDRGVPGIFVLILDCYQIFLCNKNFPDSNFVATKSNTYAGKSYCSLVSTELTSTLGGCWNARLRVAFVRY